MLTISRAGEYVALSQVRLEARGKGTGEPDCGILDTVRFEFVQKSRAGGFGSITLTLSDLLCFIIAITPAD